ncbi:hypothetical protein RN001_013625 [Aquatica leii]|uniref:MYND-type domain-containing protein n=1 Tax=Aquatica leii TaxID=1421715 RepID=A0AAN7Q003_9COLE|nr:hypothetical protein RN001_013625 [Aquatica leii]
MWLTRNEKQRLRTSKSARRKKYLTHNFELQEADGAKAFSQIPSLFELEPFTDMNNRPTSVEKMYINYNTGASITSSDTTHSNVYRQNQLIQLYQPSEKLSFIQKSINCTGWEEPNRQQSIAEGNAASNKCCKLTLEQKAVFQFQCNAYNNLIKRFYTIFGKSKQPLTTHPIVQNTRAYATSRIPSTSVNNGTNQQINRLHLSSTRLPKTTPPSSSATASQALETNLYQSVPNNLQADRLTVPSNTNSRESYGTNNSSNQQMNVINPTVPSALPHIIPGFSNSVWSYSLPEDGNNPQSQDRRYTVSWPPKTTPLNSSLTSAQTVGASQKVNLQAERYSLQQNNNAQETCATSLPSRHMYVTTHPTVPSTGGNYVLSNLQGNNQPEFRDAGSSVTAIPNSNQSIQADGSSLTHTRDNTEVNKNLTEETNTTDSMNNFKIRLPLSQPRGETVTTTTVISNCNTAPSAADETTPVEKKVKFEELKKEEAQVELIDMDEWLKKEEEKMNVVDFIDLDQYDDDVVFVKTESPKLPKNDNSSNVNTVEVIPRFGSVDSGFASPPSQIEHPDVLSGERICICNKIAELVCLCGKAIYCSTDCQRTNWEAHKEECIRAREAAGASL